MSRFFREIIRKQSSSSTRFITTFTQQNPRNLPPSLLINQSILGQTPKFDHGGSGFNLNPKTQGLTEDFTHLSKLQIYPSFSIGYLIDPISASGVGPIGVETGHPGTMWADSVKKKRKKKMNKHKYKKLRKRLRRKTKT